MLLFLQGTASEATLVALLAARSCVIQRERARDASLSAADVIGKLVCYTSDQVRSSRRWRVTVGGQRTWLQAHSSVERAALLGAVKCHKVESDGHSAMRCEALQAAMQRDISNGLIPFYVRPLWPPLDPVSLDPVLVHFLLCNQSISSRSASRRSEPPHRARSISSSKLDLFVSSLAFSFFHSEILSSLYSCCFH